MPRFYLQSTGSLSAAALVRPVVGSFICIHCFVCTAEYGQEATDDNALLRSGAVAAGVPLTTTLAGFTTAVRALAEEGAIGESGVRTLQEYHARLAAGAS